ncbi:phosphoribosyltransferase [Duganella sp. LX20W]|uniref:Phosphoribosyltransferase n=1 Tax=Rugamonas brunnea TaxID=2758569 RepID=A0A7W2IBZ9_9BURK|nr:phosphoribosyltransferase family protein [Rugamonas brunnea]MBA5637665.1 phosphoribosyltransferase [Rugamonas brunnea]
MSKVSRFKDRVHAGKLLAHALDAYAGRADVVVLALPRGGVPVGYAVARELDVDLDVLVVRKLGAPGQEELAIGAVASGGIRVIHHDMVAELGVSPDYVEALAARKMAEVAQRDELFHGGRPPVALEGRVAILVDDGIATGATMEAAVKALYHAGLARVVVAVPVASAEAVHTLRPQVDQLVCLTVPEPFFAIGIWYDDFEQTSDAEVIALLQRADAARRADARLSQGDGHAHPTP